MSRPNVTLNTIYEFSKYVVKLIYILKRQCYLARIQPPNSNSQEGVSLSVKVSLSVNGILANGSIVYSFTF